MCGIVGAMAFGKFAKKSEEQIRQDSIRFITTDLLQRTVKRGEDATGVAVLFEDGNYAGLKMGIKSPEFIAKYGGTEKDFKGLLKIWREYPKTMRVYLGHCRKASVGNSFDNKNNHPIRVGDTIAVKNGTLKNHDIIFKELGCPRDGEVDSEAVVRLLHHFTKDGEEPFTTEMLKEVTKRLEGTFSVLAVCANNPFQVAQFRETRPAEMVLVRPLKTVFVASDKDYLENALYEYLKIGNLMEPTVKFVSFGADDLDWKVLVEESVAVWDLQKDITAKTKIDDLYDWAKSDTFYNKIWKEATYKNKSNVNTQPANNWNKNKSTVNAAGRNSSASKPANDDDDDDSEGLVWSDNKFTKYKTQKGIKETKELGSTEIDADAGTVKQLDPEGNPVVLPNNDMEGLKRVASEKIDGLISDPATIEEINAEDIQQDVKKLQQAGFTSKSVAKKSNGSSESGNGKSVSEDEVKVREVDMSQDPEALAKAQKFVDSGLPKYVSEKELLDDLEFENDDWVHNLPIFSLANRIQMYFAKKYFYAGYRARKEEEGGMDRKEISAEKKIRTLKATTKILGRIIDELPIDDKLEELTKSALKAVIKSTKVLTPEQVDEAFSLGDIKNIPVLTYIKKELTPKD